MTMVTGEADSARQPRAMRSELLRQIWISRTDYLYVLARHRGDADRHRLPIYYTIDLSSTKRPPGLQLRDKIFVGVDNYSAISQRGFWRVTLTQ